MMDLIEREKVGAHVRTATGSGRECRLGMPATIEQTGMVAALLEGQFPTVVAAIRAQVKEIQDSEVDVHGTYAARVEEPAAGLVTDAIELIRIYRE